MLRRRDDIMKHHIYCTDCEGAGFHYWPVYAKCETCDGTGKLSRDPPGWTLDAISGLWFVLIAVVTILLVWAWQALG
jgi:hypothetical protein